MKILPRLAAIMLAVSTLSIVVPAATANEGMG